MGRQPCCDKVGLKKGPWTAEEDKKLINFILTNGQCCWRAVPKLAGWLLWLSDSFGSWFWVFGADHDITSIFLPNFSSLLRLNCWHAWMFLLWVWNCVRLASKRFAMEFDFGLKANSSGFFFFFWVLISYLFSYCSSVLMFFNWSLSKLIT